MLGRKDEGKGVPLFFKDWRDELSKKEQKVVVICAALILFSFAVIFTEETLVRWLKSRQSSAPVIGQIEASGDDVRFKEERSFTWYTTTEEQELRLGDSIFTGESSEAKIELGEGTQLELGAKSLVSFKRIGQSSIADIQAGIFKFKISGDAKIAVRGEVFNLSGDNSEVEINVGKNKSVQFKQISGTTKIKNKDGTKQNLPTEPTRVSSNLISQSIPFPEEDSRKIPYTWKLYDQFTRDGIELKANKILRPRIEKELKLTWSDLDTQKDKYYVEHSPREDFTERDRKTTDSSPLILHELFVGPNFWRVKKNQGGWSATRQFEVVPNYLDKGWMRVLRQTEKVPYLFEVAQTPVKIIAPINIKGIVVQASTSSQFVEEKTRTFWSDRAEFNLSFYHPGTYYYRFRAVNPSFEMTDWTSVEKFEVFAPLLLSQPEILRKTQTLLVKETAHLKWKDTNGAISYEIDIFNSKGKRVESIATQDSELKWTTDKAGKYSFKVYAVDQYGRRGRAGSTLAQYIDQPKVDQVAGVQRKPSQVADAEATSSIKVDQPDLRHNNTSYSSSHIELEGAAYALISQQQLSKNQPTAISTGFAVRNLTWVKDTGYEGSFKAGVFAVNEAGKEVAPKQLELRLHKRTFKSLPFKISKEMQASLFGGVEVYRNEVAELYSKQYDIVKFGTSLEFPVGKNFDTGGEIAIGQGLDSSHKYEISGHVRYYPVKDWSMGAGYRIHLFQAGSDKSAPVHPYREGYTEGYSVIRYHY